MNRTLGSLTAADVGREVRLSETGLLVTGLMHSVEHSVSLWSKDKGQPQTKVIIRSEGSRMSFTRAAHVEIDVEPEGEDA
jgi:hypothetical protein